MNTDKVECPVPKGRRKSNEAAEFDAWMAKYGPVEQAVFEARERRARNRERRRQERDRRFGDLCEATEGLAKKWMRDGVPYEAMYELVKGDPWALQCLLRHAGAAATRRIKRLSDAARRPLYYEKENARRRALAAERRRIAKRSTTSARPTREQILDAWIHRRDSHEAALRFGSALMDLECYLDSSLLFAEGGAICGRRGGIKRWLQEEIPALYLRYTTVMRFKAMARKVRQVVELSDPTPAAAVVEAPRPGGDARHGEAPGGAAGGTGGKAGSGQDGTEAERDYVAEKSRCTAKSAAFAGGGDPQWEIGILRARAIWLEVTDGIGRSPTALMARVDALLDPENVEEANMLRRWRERYTIMYCVKGVREKKLCFGCEKRENGCGTG